MGVEIRDTICLKCEDREVSAGDFAPWSYNLHYITASEPWSYRHHRHWGCFELVYTLSGTVEHLLDGSWREFSSGDLLAVGEEDYHSIRGRQFSYANLILPTAYWTDRMADLGIGDPLGSPTACGGRTVRIPAEERTEFRGFLDQLFHAQQTDAGERLLRRFLGFLVYNTYWTEASGNEGEAAADGPSVPSWWNDLVHRVESAESFPEDVRDLADRAGRSREHMARTCRKATGLSPSAWLNGLRLERAALLLRKTNREIADIAFEAGFGSLEHFYRLFRREFDAPPGRYRRENGEAS